MAEAASASGSLSQRLDIDALILGVVKDLDDLRNGKISVREAMARAELAKQAMNGVRLVITAQKFLENSAISISPPA